MLLRQDAVRSFVLWSVAFVALAVARAQSDRSAFTYVAGDSTAGEGATITQGEQSLLRAALLLAGVYAGADDEAMASLRRLGATWARLDAGALASAVDVDLKTALAGAK